MLFAILVGILALLIYFKIVKPQKYWKEKGAACIKPWPIVGSMGPLVFNKKSYAGLIQDIYNVFPEKRCVGFHLWLKPVLMIRDPELIKQIMVKDFDTFPVHQPLAPEGIDSLWDRNVFGTRESSRWHDLRAILSQAFTSSKLKAMFSLIKDCATQTTNHLLKQNKIVTVDAKAIFTKFENDAIGTIAFGITCNSFANPENEFYKMGQRLTNPSGLNALKTFFGYSISPAFMKLFKITLVPPSIANFFKGIIKETIDTRKEKGIVRPDMIHLLMEAQKAYLRYVDKDLQNSSSAVAEKRQLGRIEQKKTEITDEDITSHAILFFVASFDTTSSLLSFMCYELALNPDIQQRLIGDIDTTLEGCNGEITYEALMAMKYLDMVVSETLRKWPPTEITDRDSIRDYVIQPKLSGEQPIYVDANTSVWIPTYAIHRDPQYYPNPDKFDPERFSEENKNDIKPFTYLPFGAGPRNCIGARLALLKVKLCILEILTKFEIIAVEETQIPLVLRKGGINMPTDKGMWVGYKPRIIVQ
ncbi:hypothetical protein ILUMI_05749 [Ignelater luminosus]|uniref:Cytochrome P450 n=1 Tax=Ignelater luminosus TaxID=2038154 RepID=A0A8K0GG27_IGNLU|nr:hypothetical protein ILUMI_05749 [Ignelater luminosus]